MKEKIAKNSITRQITRRISIILAIALILLFFGSLHTVSDLLLRKEEKYSQAVVTIFSDYVTDEFNKAEDKSEEKLKSIINFTGKYLCDWYSIGYAYFFSPDIENNKITYLTISSKKGEDIELGTEDYVLSEGELKVWNGEQPFATLETNNIFGHEISTVIRCDIVLNGETRHYFADVDVPYSQVYSNIAKSFIILGVLILITLVGVYVAVFMLIRRKVSLPTKKISATMQEYMLDEKASAVRLNENQCEEYKTISTSYNNMIDNIEKYLQNIKSLTDEQLNRKAELNIASKIQYGFLPKKDFNGDGFFIHAMMLPAKEVGGDFYDYLELGNDKVLLVCADVSDKGIVAALFMAVTIMTIRSYAKMNLSPSEILKKTNDTLSENNAGLLFATAFVGIYDKKTKELAYSNAGHNSPYIISDEIIKLDGARGCLVGLFEGEGFTVDKVQLKCGDIFFAYTDGVTESTNSGKFFGLERLEKTLMEYHTAKALDIVQYVYSKLEDFSGDSERHDDITMLTMTVQDEISMELLPEITEMEKIKEKILELPLSKEKKLNLCLATEECFVNICTHAFTNLDKENQKIQFSLIITDKVKVELSDYGIPYNPFENLSIPNEDEVDDKIGGLGQFIAFNVIDDVHYKYENNKNILTLIIFSKEN
ncbi:MAG: SpoIIE family protein phosphatase [Firmicutes bacterium]|nr:SpoIIE family protein phosphatase [Candidatus Caballimonas caccae]